MSTCHRWYDFGYIFIDESLTNELIEYLCDYAFIDSQNKPEIIKDIKYLLNELNTDVLIGYDARVEIAEKLEVLLAKFRYQALINSTDNEMLDEFSCTEVFPHILMKINDYYYQCCRLEIFPNTLEYRLPSQ